MNKFLGIVGFVLAYSGASAFEGGARFLPCTIVYLAGLCGMLLSLRKGV